MLNESVNKTEMYVNQFPAVHSPTMTFNEDTRIKCNFTIKKMLVSVLRLKQ